MLFILSGFIHSMTLASSLLCYGSVSNHWFCVTVALYIKCAHLMQVVLIVHRLYHIFFICRFVVILPSCILFLACLHQISSDMTCAFDRNWDCNGMSTAYNGFNYMISIAPNASEDRSRGAAIRISVRRSVQGKVDVIIAKSPTGGIWFPF